MTDRDLHNKALRRAKKIMAMADQTASPEEAANAMSSISKYIDLYGFTVEQLRDEGVDKRFGETTCKKRTKSKLPNWYTWLGLAVGKITEARVVTYFDGQNHTLQFQGMEGSQDISLDLMEYLEGVLNRCLKNYLKDFEIPEGVTKAQIVIDFRRGFANEMVSRAKVRESVRESSRDKESSGSGSSLVLIKKDLIAKNFKGVRKSTRKPRSISMRDPNAWEGGRQSARDTNLNKQVGSTSQPML